MPVALRTTQQATAAARVAAVISEEPRTIPGAAGMAHNTGSNGLGDWQTAGDALEALQNAETARNVVDIPAAYRDTAIDPRTGCIVVRDTRAAAVGNLRSGNVTHHGLTQLLSRMGVPRSAHVSHAVRWLPTWARSTTYEGCLQSTRTLQKDAQGPAVVLRFAAGELRAAPGAAGFHDGFLDDLPVFKALAAEAIAGRWWRSFSESYLQVQYGDKLGEAVETVSCRNSEVGSSSLSFRASLRIRTAQVTIDSPRQTVVIADEDQSGATRRHTLPRADKQRVAQRRIAESIAQARDGFAALAKAWETSKGVFPEGWTPEAASAFGADAAAEVLLDRALECGRMPEGFDRRAVKKAMVDTGRFVSIPWGSAAYMACVVASLGEGLSDATSRADAAALAGRWLFEGWKR